MTQQYRQYATASARNMLVIQFAFSQLKAEKENEKQSKAPTVGVTMGIVEAHHKIPVILVLYK